MSRGGKIGRHWKLSEENKRNIGLAKIGNKARLGMKNSIEANRKTGLGNSIALRGRKLSTELRKKYSEVQKKRVLGGTHNFWKGGIDSINKRIRGSLEYRLWREAVFKRDNWTCIWCGIRGGKLEADHIKRFSDYPELRFAIDNGRTLCKNCHLKTDTHGRNKKI